MNESLMICTGKPSTLLNLNWTWKIKDSLPEEKESFSRMKKCGTHYHDLLKTDVVLDISVTDITFFHVDNARRSKEELINVSAKFDN